MVEILHNVVLEAINEISSQNLKICTFALYHDHESHAVSVCADTLENSHKSIRLQNAYNMKYFAEHAVEGEYEDLELWQANVGRNLSLGDFSLVNLARANLPDDVIIDTKFYLEMVRAIIGRQQEIIALAETKDDLIFCCSGPDSEVALVWIAIDSA